jgi:hypothetical protein
MGLLAAFLVAMLLEMSRAAPVAADNDLATPTWHVYLPLIHDDLDTARVLTPSATPSPTRTASPTRTPSPTTTFTSTPRPTSTEIEFFALYPGQAHMTDGIIAIAIIIVLVIIFGIVWGGGMKIQRPPKPPKS